LSLKFKIISKNKIEFEIPENKNTITDGTYLIYAISNSGVPSEGKITYIK